LEPAVRFDSFAPLPDLKLREFESIRSLAFESFGIDLGPGKQKLVHARLGKHVRAGHFRSFEEYLQHVRRDPSGQALRTMIDSLTTNHTSFLRESQHFNVLCELIQERFAGRRQAVRIWSAACATGEEPYSILMALAEKFGRPVTHVQVLASDISTRALSVAAAGVYTRERLTTLPPDWAAKYFEKRSDGSYSVIRAIRSQVVFERRNLMESTRPGDLYPVIFCRNVMIYFNKATQTQVIRRLSAALEPGGYLFVGHAESLAAISHALAYIRPAVYLKPER
jgi:chemotaxis protein methyltransferase CheR